MYDPAVFFNTSIPTTDMQQEVEKPQIYLLAMSSDTTEDKLTFIQDRLLYNLDNRFPMSQATL